jgi:hypothetical protein
MPITWDSLPFETKKERLPPYYSGHNLKNVIEKLSSYKNGLRKNEFETSEEYADRISPILSRFGLLAFSVCLKSDKDEQEIWYSADDRKLTVRRLFYGGTFKYEDRKVRSYPAQTIGGAKVIVSVTETKFWNLELSESQARPSDGYVQYNIEMSPETARAAKNNIRLLIIFQPAGVDKTKGYASAKWPSLKEGPVYNYNLQGILQEMWIYNFVTGEVLLRSKW